jgi:hypothetical protein
MDYMEPSKLHSHSFTLFVLSRAISCVWLFSPGLLLADPSPTPIAPVDLIYPLTDGETGRLYEIAGSELTERGRNVKGVYIPIGRLMTWSPRQIVHWVSTKVGANAVIIDVKDDRGRVTFSRELPDATGSPHGMLRKKMDRLVQGFKEADIYVIGRLVCFKDTQFARIHPLTAIRDRRDGKPWRDRSRLAWLDPYSALARAYIVSVARAAAELGLDEIQLDYVRFPVEPSTRYARFDNQSDGEKRYEAIAALLADMDRALSIPISIDVFGLTAYHPKNSEALGQLLEHLAPYIDAISPMLYLANWPRYVWENPKPERTHALVHNAILKIRERLGDDIAVRPLLQGFSYRAENYGTGFIHNQIDAAVTAGSSGYLFWNQSGHYLKVSQVWRRLARIKKDNLEEIRLATNP